MSEFDRLSVLVPPELAQAVREAVDGERYVVESDVVIDALQDWQVKRQIRAAKLKRYLISLRIQPSDDSANAAPLPLFQIMRTLFLDFRFRLGRELVLNFRGTEVGRLSMEFLHDGIPMPRRKAVVKPTGDTAVPVVPPAALVWPKPPAPRSDPARSSTGTKLACSTRCNTSWATRSPRRTMYSRAGSVLTSNTFSSPR